MTDGRRTMDDWQFSLIGNEAENLRSALEDVGISSKHSAVVSRWIDRAKVAWARGDDWIALAELSTANRALGYAQAPHDEAEFLRRFAFEGGKAKAAKSPKAAAKRDALALWIERHEGKQPGLRTVEQFAMEVMRRCPVLESSVTICRWSAKWTKQVREGGRPTL